MLRLRASERHVSSISGSLRGRFLIAPTHVPLRSLLWRPPTPLRTHACSQEYVHDGDVWVDGQGAYDGVADGAAGFYVVVA
jgi:hypothetical protein